MHLLAECNTIEFVQHKLRQSVEQPHQCGVRNPEYSAISDPTKTHKNTPNATFACQGSWGLYFSPSRVTILRLRSFNSSWQPQTSIFVRPVFPSTIC